MPRDAAHAASCPFPTLLQRVSFAKTPSSAVAPQKGKGAKGKPPKPPGAAAAGDDAAAKAKQPDTAVARDKQQAAAVDVGEPNAKLFVENLPAATTAAMLEMLFKQFPGAGRHACCLAEPAEPRGSGCVR